MMPIWKTQKCGRRWKFKSCVSGAFQSRCWWWSRLGVVRSLQPGTAKLRVGGRNLSLRAWASPGSETELLIRLTVDLVWDSVGRV